MKSLPRAVKVLIVLSAGLLSAATLGVLVLGGAYLYFGPQLPQAGEIGEPKLNEPLRIYSADGRLIGEFGTERRLPLKYDDIPETVVQAFLSAEDDRFFDHPGVDYQGILRAAWNVATTGTKTQGGSTITMQLARNLYLSRERTYVRKLKEIFLALRMEAKLSKRQIMEIYLNKIYLGHRSYGVGAAAEVYYRKPIDELSLAQVATLAGLPKAPSRYNPKTNPERATQRRNYVLRRMYELDFIDQPAYASARAETVVTDDKIKDERYEADYVAEMVRQDIVERFGDEAYTAGYEVTTTIDSARQRAANRALRRGLLAYDQRHAWRGAEATLDKATLDDPEALNAALADRPDAGGLVPAAVISVRARTARLYTEKYGALEVRASDIAWLQEGQAVSDFVSPGDVVRLAYTGQKKSEWALAQIPEVQGALVALSPEDGAIEALIGGFDFNISKFNRAVQARRQPGSAFKPFLYSAALANGLTPASIINDAPVVFDDPNLDRAWRPENYSGRIYGPTRLREGLVRSRNLVSIRLMRDIGIDTSIRHISRFGLPAERMNRDLSLALGSASFSPLQMARAFAVFANGGFLVDPYFIKEIRDDAGEVVHRARPPQACAEDCEDPQSRTGRDLPLAPRVVDADNVYLMNSMMRDVAQRGTAAKARKLGRSDIAGKTGTTNEQRDAWFAGFNHDLTAVCWVGFDQLKPLGGREAGSRAALPMWIDFMGSALEGVPESTLPRPPGLVTVRINSETGRLASAADGGTLFETFREGNVPEPERRTRSGEPVDNSGGEVERLF